MSRFSAFFVPILVLFFLCVESAPARLPTGLSIRDIINALHVKAIEVVITPDTLVTNLVEVNLDAKNVLPVEVTIDRIPFVVPIFGTKNSGHLRNVLLVQGASAMLDIVPLGFLDLISVDFYARAGTINGQGGTPIPIKGLKQSNVPTMYNLIFDK